MKYFIIVLMSIFIFATSVEINADDKTKPIKKAPVIQEMFDNDIVISWRRPNRYDRIRRERRERRERIERHQKRQRYYRHHRYPRHRGCFISTMFDK